MKFFSPMALKSCEGYHKRRTEGTENDSQA